jgi:YVTN family beta-propeller protein
VVDGLKAKPDASTTRAKDRPEERVAGIAIKKLPGPRPLYLSVLAAGTSLGLLGAMSLASGTPALAAPKAVTVVATFAASQPLDVYADSLTGNIYVPNTSGSTIEVFSATTNSSAPIATVGVGKQPRRIAVDDSRGYVYVTNFASDSLSVVGDADGIFSTIASVPVGPGPDSAAVDTANGDVYVTDTGSNSVSVVDPVALTVVDTIAVGAYPNGIAYDTATGELYVANQNADSVSVIDGTSNTVTDTITLPPTATPHGVTFDPATDTIYVGDGRAAMVTAINGGVSQLYGTDQVMWGAPAGNGAHHVAIDSDDNLFVTDYQGNRISAVSDAGIALGSFGRNCTKPDGISYDDANGDLYIACSGANRVVVVSDGARVR